MAQLNLRLHWTLAAIVLLADILIVALTIFLDKTHHVKPPESGHTDTFATIGWLGVCGAVFIFGCYGIMIKTPSVQEANCDCMVFQCYYSTAVVCVSMLIWLVAGSHDGLTFNGGSFLMGLFFATLWIISQMGGYNAIRAIGYAVGPAIWIGVTITVSFVWGVAAFHNPVHSWPGAIGALAMMLAGVCLAAASSAISDRQSLRNVRELSQAVDRTDDSALLSAARDKAATGTAVFGILSACCCGVCNGSLMVSMNCFQNGCPAIGVEPYTGAVLAPLAFLPSLAAGISVAQPVLFLLYWGRSMLAGHMPQFHFSKVATSGLLTGAFWGMGNFNAMYATVYLGQTVGFPLTQCCLIISGAWGILYYKEVKGAAAIGTFVLASIIILAGATLDGISC